MGPGLKVFSGAERTFRPLLQLRLAGTGKGPQGAELMELLDREA